MDEYDLIVDKKINVNGQTVILRKGGNRYERYYYTFEVGTQFPYTTVLADSPEGLQIKRAFNKALKKNRKEQEKLEAMKKERRKKGNVTFEEALKIARDYFAAKEQKIIQIYETDDKWIAFGGTNREPSINQLAITINKVSENIGSFALPYKNKTEILKTAVLRELPDI